MKILQILIFIFGLSIFANAQTKAETLFVLKGKIISQEIQLNAVVEFSFQDKVYQSKIEQDNTFEIKLPKGIYQVKIINKSVGGVDEYLFEKINVKNTGIATFDLGKADSVIVSCDFVTMPEVIVIPDDIKPSNDVKLRTVQKLLETKNINNKRKN